VFESADLLEKMTAVCSPFREGNPSMNYQNSGISGRLEKPRRRVETIILAHVELRTRFEIGPNEVNHDDGRFVPKKHAGTEA
tara:strand:- start:8172 stop:8417 length:246 start_codon:yes stop_codon:yes gene_type:complete